MSETPYDDTNEAEITSCGLGCCCIYCDDADFDEPSGWARPGSIFDPIPDQHDPEEG